MNHKNHFKSIPDILRQRAMLTPNKTAIQSISGDSWTFEELEKSTSQIACYIRDESGGGRIGIVMSNGPDLTLTILAATYAGIAMPLNPAHSQSEFMDYFQRLNISCLIVDSAQSKAAAAAKELSIRILRPTPNAGRSANKFEFSPAHSDIALILMTSGSTGKPKLVPLSHQNLCVSAAQVAESVKLTESDICLSMWELFHIGGLVDLLLAPILSGGMIISTPGIQTDLFFQLVSQFQPTWFQAVPTTLHAILAETTQRQYSASDHRLRFIRSVAAKLPDELKSQIEEEFSVPVIQTFGMTEAGPLITSTHLPPVPSKPDSVGTSCGTDIRVLGPKLEPLSTGNEGEIAIRGDNVFAGYEGDSEENRERFIDGWFLTGDLGRLDQDGHLFLTGRAKQLINRGGEKINPLEVEGILKKHSAVRDAAAFSVEHRTLGEDIAAAVILESNQSHSESDLRAYVSNHLAAFKLPQRILFLNTFPMTSIGKLDRPELARIANQKAKPTAEATDASKMELELAKLWEREMNVESIDIDDNFFAAGGDSLMGLRLLTAVEKWHGAAIPEAMMRGISTVREMAQLLSAAEGTNRTMADNPNPPPINHAEIVMNSGEIPTLSDCKTIKAIPSHTDTEEAPPLYWCFNSPDREMSHLVNAWTGSAHIMGLYSGHDTSDEVNEAMASHYFEVIRDRRHARPFYLGGNCRGARVAAKLLIKLKEAGLSPKGTILMEHATKAVFELDHPTLFLFGESSRVSKWNQRPVWRHAKKKTNAIQAAYIKGTHGQFFSPENISSLETSLKNFISSLQKL